MTKKKTFGLAMAAAMAFAAGFATGAQIPEGDGGETLKVGTYNIRCPIDKGENAWDNRCEDLVKFLGNLEFDVFGMQEVTPGQAAYIKEHLPQYEYVGEFRNADRKTGEASPVCYRKARFEALKSGTFWLSETPDVPGSKSWGTWCTRVCSWVLLKDRKTGRAFCFANVHTDHISAEARREGMLLVIRRMGEFAPEGTPIVFTGDHNCCENEEPAMAVAKLLKDSIYATETPPQGAWRTYNGWQWKESEFPAVEALKVSSEERNVRNKTDSGVPTGKRIDYIYVSNGVRVKTHVVDSSVRPGTKCYFSDHFPVAATIVLPEK